MPLAGKDQRGRASAHYKWAERYNRYGDAHRSASHFGRALYYTTTGANFGGNSNCPQGKLCADSRGEHLNAFAHDCAFGPMCTRDNDHHVKTMHLLNLHRANGVAWSADEHYDRVLRGCSRRGYQRQLRTVQLRDVTQGHTTARIYKGATRGLPRSLQAQRSISQTKIV